MASGNARGSDHPEGVRSLTKIISRPVSPFCSHLTKYSLLPSGVTKGTSPAENGCGSAQRPPLRLAR